MIVIYYSDDVFIEIAESLHFALKELKIPNLLTDEMKIDDSNMYIMIGLNNPQVRMPKRYIAYQFEQTGNRKSWFTEEYVDKLKGAIEIWDYSIRNIQNIKVYGELPLCRYVPLCYMDNLTCIDYIKNSESEKKYDILFYGSACPRRDDIIFRLRKEGFRVYYGTNNLWGADRNRLIKQSKIILNIHYYPRPVLETSRLSYLIANKAFVISEPSLDPILDSEYKNYVKIVEYDEIVNECRYYLENPKSCEEFVEKSIVRYMEKKYPDVIPLNIIKNLI